MKHFVSHMAGKLTSFQKVPIFALSKDSIRREIYLDDSDQALLIHNKMSQNIYQNSASYLYQRHISFPRGPLGE